MVGASVAAASRSDRSSDVAGSARSAASLYFVYRAYADYVIRLEDEHRRREVIDSLQEGMCVVDRDSHITLWNDALERILGCPGIARSGARCQEPFRCWGKPACRA